jgi:hypothetical protein
MKITVRTYRFDTSKADGREAWAAFQAARKADGLRVFSTLGDDQRTASARNYRAALEGVDGVPVELDAARIFENQLNTGPVPGSATGLRVFDWKHDIWPNRHIQSGHWIEQTEELRALRRSTYVCGYCGKQEQNPAHTFCQACTDSEYLKPEDLKLTRMRRVCDTGPGQRFPDLTDAERAELLPRYTEAQLRGSTERGRARIAKARERIEREYAETETKVAKMRADAEVKHRAATWIIGNAPGVLSNWIYYEHTGRHTFGWMHKLSPEVVSELLDRISEFPFPYDIECADGRKLSGER